MRNQSNPKIIYVGCFGYSQRGPYAAKAAYDDMIQGASGLPWLLQKQGAAEPRYAPMIVADRSVGQQVASAVSAALYHREKTGKGQRVDVPMWEHLLQIVLSDHLGGYTFDPQHGEPGYARILTPDRRPYQTKRRLRLRADLQRQAVEGVLRHHRPSGDDEAARSSPPRRRAARTTRAPTP